MVHSHTLVVLCAEAYFRGYTQALCKNCRRQQCVALCARSVYCMLVLGRCAADCAVARSKAAAGMSSTVIISRRPNSWLLSSPGHVTVPCGCSLCHWSLSRVIKGAPLGALLVTQKSWQGPLRQDEVCSILCSTQACTGVMTCCLRQVQDMRHK